MDLDDRQCYDALQSRDDRFDGRFWVGVRTTGIYCRPVCPSRTPKAANVAFYAHPAAAEDAGFRPCLRCRPDAAPGSDGWLGNAALVDRAVRLIDDGALDDGGTAAMLADRLHVGDRHLRRLFQDRYGTTPDAVARSRRAHVARRLLVETDLRVADVAFAAGFGSVRQCNDQIRSTFQATPTELRRGRSSVRDRPVAPAGGPLTLRLRARPPFDGLALLDWFAARAVTGLETVDAGVYTRRVRLLDRAGNPQVADLAITPDHEGVRVRVDVEPATPLAPVLVGIRRLFDLAADPTVVDAHLGADPLLAPLVAARPGARVPGCWSGFEAVVRAVIGQQISVPAARTVLGRIVAAHGPGSTFPGPEDVVDVPLEELGIIGARSTTIRTVAAAVLDGTVVLDGSATHEELVASLVAVRGIGPWTAEYVALRMGEPDAFPAGDLHLDRVLGVTKPTEALARTEPWRPWRAYAAMHLWQTTPEEIR